MSDIYELSNWTNAVKIKNKLSPKLKIDVLQLDNQQGYILTVFEELPENMTNILYRIPVECTIRNSWSLSNLEAVDMLNTLGFPCMWTQEVTITKSVYDILIQLRDFGWKNIIRSVRPTEIYLSTDSQDSSLNSLTSVVPNAKYSDWVFLDNNIPISIESLLESYAFKGD